MKMMTIRRTPLDNESIAALMKNKRITLKIFFQYIHNFYTIKFLLILFNYIKLYLILDIYFFGVYI